ncbi:MAG: histidinol-phosphate transaminase [Chloroflexi bacterium]|nr:histidinol-phosphate transaminase [Chloroflexota bacterium]
MRGNTRHSVKVRPAILGMSEYVPVHPLDEISRELGIPVDQLVKLDANENPYGCSPAVQQAIARCSTYHIYPDPEQRQLRAALARYSGFPADWLLAGAGSDELIDLLIRLTVEPGEHVLDAIPTFGMYSFLTPIQGGEIVSVPRRPDFGLDLPALLAAIDSRTKLIFVASPNNPSGNLATRAEIVALLDTGLLVVVDEAYYEFSRQTVADLVGQYENLVVLRTFSKWAGLAGLRVGYLIASPAVLAHLWKMKQPYNVNAAAQAAACAAIDDLAYIQQTIESILTEREHLFVALAGTAFLRPLPTSSNFILCRVADGSARSLRDALRQRGILIRYFDTPLLQSAIRVSVGKPEDTVRLRAALAGVRPA